MPDFIAPFARNHNLWGSVYSLDILPPPSWGKTSGLLEGLIVYDYDERFAEPLVTIETTLISPELALAFGANQPGDEIVIVIRQRSHRTLDVHEFDPIPLKVGKFAPAALGRNFLMIGYSDIEKFFSVELCVPPAADPSQSFLFLEPHRQYRHWCRQIATSGSS